jgi:trans-aconitate methyltransferase
VGTRLLDAFASVTFMDSSPGMIEQAKREARRSAERARSGLRPGAAGRRSLRFDCVFTSMVLHHIRTRANPFALLWDSQQRRRLIVVDLDKDDGSFHASEPALTGTTALTRGSLHADGQGGFGISGSKPFTAAKRR